MIFIMLLCFQHAPCEFPSRDIDANDLDNPDSGCGDIGVLFVGYLLPSLQFSVEGLSTIKYSVIESPANISVSKECM